MSALAITRSGAITAVGPTLRHTGLFVRAGQEYVAQAPFIDALGEHVMMCASPLLPRNLLGIDRLCALAERSCIDAFQAQPEPELVNPHLLLVVPERVAQLPAQLSRLEQAVRSVLPGPLAHARGAVIAGRGATGARAFQEARKRLQDDTVDGVIVVAVDSYHGWPELEALIAADQLLTPDNLDGRRPGEAAAALLLTGTHHRLARTERRCLLRGVAVAREAVPLGHAETSNADGISQAFRQLSAGLAHGSVCQFVGDTTHEAYRVRELQILIARFGSLMGTPFTLTLPARELGEVGAATLVLYAALLAEAGKRGYEGGATHVAFGGGEASERGALLVEIREESR